MISILEIFIIVAILSLNFATIIWIKSSSSLIFSTISTGLAIIFLCVVNISDIQILQSIVIAILIYSAVVIALVSSANSQQNSTPLFKNKIHGGLILLFILAVSSGVFYVGKNIDGRPVAHNENKMERIIGIVDSVRVVGEKMDQKNLENNVFLKNSTDVILLIVGLMMAIILAGKSRGSHSGTSTTQKEKSNS
jgi:hypothetical protein